MAKIMVVDDAAKAITALDPHSKIIMCSAMGQQGMVLQAIQAGAKDFVVKPFQKDRVQEAIAKVVG
jgi:two-component system chemotaxis response regulator CheY